MKTFKLKPRWPLAAALSLLLLGCGQSNTPVDKTAPTPTSQLQAATPELQKLYNSTCRNCHSVPASGAPQAGDRTAWTPRLAQGREVLLDHAITGYKGMPPMGGCTQCSEQDFAALIAYMAARPL